MKFTRSKALMNMALAGASGIVAGMASTAASRLDMGPSDRGPVSKPAGGLRLVQVPDGHLDHYLVGRTRDARSFPMRDRHGNTYRPSLRYFTHVNYSRIYFPAKPGHRECVRRRPGFYKEVAQDLATIQVALEGTA